MAPQFNDHACTLVRENCCSLVKKPQASHPKFEFRVADLIGFYPGMYDAVSQVKDQVVSIQLAMSRMPASQRDHQQIGQRLLDAIA